MKHYDFILAGGGSAGLGLAYQMIDSPLGDRSILVVDQKPKDTNDRTWCFWTTEPTPFDQLIYRSWDSLYLKTHTMAKRIALNPYRYHMIRGIDFYQFTRRSLCRFPNVEILEGTVERIDDEGDRAAVRIDGSICTAEWVFDSRFLADEFHPCTRRYHDLKQHFKGWEIETSEPTFDPSAATLFDFRTPQHDTMRFMYVLPFSARRALVEYTLFSADLLAPGAYEDALRVYLRDVLTLEEYHIVAEEDGIIPMTDQPFPRRAGQHIMTTGTRGGRVKASTGFCFLRTQRDNAAIVRSLLQRGHPFDVPSSPARYRVFDALLLQIMFRHGHLSERIFTELFVKNSVQRLFRFLDEVGTPWENLQLMATVPPWPFLRAWLKLALLRRP